MNAKEFCPLLYLIALRTLLLSIIKYCTSLSFWNPQHLHDLQNVIFNKRKSTKLFDNENKLFYTRHSIHLIAFKTFSLSPLDLQLPIILQWALQSAYSFVNFQL